ncbi:hypothetical protein D1013_11950 [Euzebyella marina]|uniref:Nuclear transport factor 2 family protein n=1 Tax=Euzebyella marina TaxID=1761453 RepID=A0A3G2L729_9FLAO|nr:ester cyclase [Euzebyella marina]AYN68036.1 hypothetical protein D1013_11950 [Euzebyella marina]
MKCKLSSYGLITLFLFSCQNQSKSNFSFNSESPSENMEETVNAYWGCWNTNKSESLKCILADDFKRFANGKLEASNQEELIALVDNWHTTIPDFKTDLQNLVIHDNQAFYRWVSTGTFIGRTGVGRSTSIYGFAILTFDDEGKISKHESYYDSMSLFRSQGNGKTPSP